MLIKIKRNANRKDVDQFIQKLGGGQAGVKIINWGDDRYLVSKKLTENSPVIEEIKDIKSKHHLSSREFKLEDTVIAIGNTQIGGSSITIIAGPCAIETELQIKSAARFVKAAGAHILRGGAFKPRTSPHSFRGLEEEGLKYLQEAGKEVGLPVVTEVMTAEDVPLVAKYADILQIGSRNMQNYMLLDACGKIRKPILLKRGLSSTVDEFLLASEYILAGGNQNVILCERGIRTFENAFRNTLDLNAVAYLKQVSHLPVIVDPSHGTGLRPLVTPLAQAAIAVGADGVIIEATATPDDALCDGAQSLDEPMLNTLITNVNRISSVVYR
ncbi:3-deoxy-7-phosphoheptulonate synthase [Candidatus Lokiarchaeum ossiferum]|uniref:3-deoxy-7-phosphoheptulonate synthase n=1 Tax=Candidatus Lokiarchaeum ossiferum TaxID=2951803 RepID=UPI00352C77A3